MSGKPNVSQPASQQAQDWTWPEKMETTNLVNSTSDQLPLQNPVDWCTPKWSEAALDCRSILSTQKWFVLLDSGSENDAGEYTLS
jgi:hypothetical protein